MGKDAFTRVAVPENGSPRRRRKRKKKQLWMVLGSQTGSFPGKLDGGDDGGWLNNTHIYWFDEKLVR